MNELTYKSCFVSDKHLLNDVDSVNKCKFCEKSIIDLRHVSKEQAYEKLKDIRNTCVLPQEGLLLDDRSLYQKIIGSAKRAISNYSGIRMVYYVMFFMIMTVFVSCAPRKNPGPPGFLLNGEKNTGSQKKL